MDVARLTDDELIAHIESLADTGEDRAALSAALDELFRRMRDEAKPGKRDYVEAVIARLTRNFSQRDDDEDDMDAAGVREPRRPAPQAGSASAAVEPPHPYGAA